VRAITVLFTLSDLNLRRAYTSLVVRQEGSAGVELAHCFTVGKDIVPRFKMATEVTLPWDGDKAAKIVCE